LASETRTVKDRRGETYLRETERERERERACVLVRKLQSRTLREEEDAHSKRWNET
jgi:hypothetical protein